MIANALHSSKWVICMAHWCPAAIMKNTDGSEYEVASAGGLARLKTVVDDIREDNPYAILLSAGDLTHGSKTTDRITFNKYLRNSRVIKPKHLFEKHSRKRPVKVRVPCASAEERAVF